MFFLKTHARRESLIQILVSLYSLGVFWGGKNNPYGTRRVKILSYPASKCTKLSATQVVEEHCGHTNLSSGFLQEGLSHPSFTTEVLVCVSFNKILRFESQHAPINIISIPEGFFITLLLCACVPHGNMVLQRRGGKLCFHWKVKNNSTPASVILKPCP